MVGGGLEVTRHGRVCTVTLPCPDAAGEWSAAVTGALRQAAESAAADARTQALVIAGFGCRDRSIAPASFEASPASCTEWREPTQPRPARRLAPVERGAASGHEHPFGYLLRLPLPVFAVLDGVVSGAGVSLALFCDHRCMGDSATLQVVQTALTAQRAQQAQHRSADSGIAWMLPRLVGPLSALEVLGSGQPVGADVADRLGLACRLPSEGLLSAVQARATALSAAASSRSIRFIKREVHDALLRSMKGPWQHGDAALQAALGCDRADLPRRPSRKSPRLTLVH